MGLSLVTVCGLRPRAQIWKVQGMSPHMKGKRQEEDPALGLQLTLITVDSVLRRVKSGEVWGNGFLYVEI